MSIQGYQIKRKIAQGGMSTVYLAVQKSVQREVALKIMSPSLNSDPNFGRRFIHEARITGHLSHQNIVAVHDVGRFKQYNYIAMDYLPGLPLKKKIRDGLSVKDTISIIKDIAKALDYSHQKGVIHRDVKPDNILFRSDGTAVLCDFGIAKALKSTANLTDVGKVLGTPYYMSPEQARGKDIDGRTDIYSLGCVAYEMLSGQPPYNDENTVAIAVKHMTADIPKLSPELKVYQPIINKLLAKNPKHRFQRPKEVIAAFDEIENNEFPQLAKDITNTIEGTTGIFPLIWIMAKVVFSTAIMSIRNTFPYNTILNKSSMQLDKKHFVGIDDFALEIDGTSNDLQKREPRKMTLPEEFSLEDETLLREPVSIIQPIPSMTIRWAYWPICFVTLVLGLFIYLDTSNPKLLIKAYSLVTQDTIVHERSENIDDYFINENNSPIIDKYAIPSVEKEKPVATSSLNDTAKNITDSEIKISALEEDLPVSIIEKHSIDINATPSSAIVKITSIKPIYSPELKLSNGSYQFEVSAKNYITKRFWLKLDNKNVIKNVSLEPTRRSLESGSTIIDKLLDGSSGPEMTILPLNTISIYREGIASRQLSLPSPVAVSSFEITFAEYDAFANATGRILPDDYSWGRLDRPVIGVTQADAIAYASWLSEQSGYNYRLPTKVEWEYAARSGRASSTWWEIKKAKGAANCRKGCNSKWGSLFSTFTSPVGSYPANLYGLHDTAGNVAEWLGDCQKSKGSEHHNEAPVVSKNSCKIALIAGGSHRDSAKAIYDLAFKSRKAMKTSKTVGFRLLVDL